MVSHAISHSMAVYRVKVLENIDRSLFTCAEPTAYLYWWRSAGGCRPFAPHSAFWCTRLSTGRETPLSPGDRYRWRSVPPNFARLPRPERVAPDRQPAPPLPATASRRRRTANLPMNNLLLEEIFFYLRYTAYKRLFCYTDNEKASEFSGLFSNAFQPRSDRIEKSKALVTFPQK